MAEFKKKNIIKLLFFTVFFYIWLLFFSFFSYSAYAGSLLVHTEPPGCQILMDGQYLGTTDNNGDLFFENLDKGAHKVTLQKDGYQSYTKEITVTDLTINISTTLKNETPPQEKEEKGELFKIIAFIGGGLFVLGLIIAIVLLVVLKKRERPTEIEGKEQLQLKTPTGALETRGLKGPPLEMLTPPPSQATDFGNYLLINKIKEGGMARIYKAKHKAKEGFYVLKIPYEQQLSDISYKDRFLQEAKLRESLSHPNIVKIWDTGEVRGLPFFAMEYVDGFNLREILNVIGNLSEKQAITVIHKTCEALDYAHNKGVLHKDLKPENILVSPLSDREEEVTIVKIIDFGLYQEVEGRTGTPPYMSPEQARREDLDAQSDLFALGVIFYELLTGIQLFFAPTQEETVQLIAQPEEVVLPQPVNPILQRIITSLLKKDKSMRLTSASMVINALDAFRFHYH